MAPLPAPGASPRTPVSPERVSVAPLRADRISAAGHALAAAFADDPVYRRLVPDSDAREHVLRAILTAGVRDALPFGTVWEARSDGETLGAALWLPPGGFPLTTGASSGRPDLPPPAR